MLADAQETLTKDNLKNEWKKLWPDKESDEENSVENENYGTVEVVIQFFDAIPGLEQCEACLLYTSRCV